MQKEILLNIKGMNCAACSASVEGALSKVDGVVYAGVNLAANSAVVVAEDKVSEQTLIEAVKKIGFGATIAKDGQMITQDEHRFKKWELVLALICGVIVMYIGMGAHWNWPLPAFISPAANPLNYALIQLIITIPVIYAGRSFFTNGMKALLKKHPTMDTDGRPDCRYFDEASRQNEDSAAGTDCKRKKGRACQDFKGCEEERLCACSH